MVGVTPLNCSTDVRRVWKVGRVLVPNLVIKGDSCLPCLVLDLCQPRLGEGNDTPLQYSYMANPMDGGAWWAAVHGVTKSRTRLKRLSSSSSNHVLGFPDGSNGKASTFNAKDPGSIPGLGRTPGAGQSNQLLYSCLENPMNRGAWRTTFHGVTKSQT